jgi:hypothetical protein
VPVAIPENVLRETAQSMVDFRDYWQDEIPSQIHSGDISDDGAPQWHPDFQRWLGVDYYGPRSDRRWSENPEPRVRTTRAFRKLRKKAVREFEVCYRIIVLGEPIEETRQWLNDRAIRNGKTDRYGMQETLLLLVSGVQKMRAWW